MSAFIMLNSSTINIFRFFNCSLFSSRFLSVKELCLELKSNPRLECTVDPSISVEAAPVVAAFKTYGEFGSSPAFTRVQ